MNVKDFKGLKQRRSCYTSGLDRKGRWNATKDRESWVWEVWGILMSPALLANLDIAQLAS